MLKKSLRIHLLCFYIANVWLNITMQLKYLFYCYTSLFPTAHTIYLFEILWLIMIYSLIIAVFVMPIYPLLTFVYHHMQKVTRFDVLSELWKGVTFDRLVLSKITVPLCLLLKGRHEKESMSVS